MRAKRASEFRAVEASAASETAQRNEYIQNTGDNFLPQIMCKLNEGPKMGITYAIYSHCILRPLIMFFYPKSRAR